MKRSALFTILLVSTLINAVMLYVYHINYQKQNALNALHSSDPFRNVNDDRELLNEELTKNRRNSITNAVGIMEKTVVSVNVLKTQVYRQNPFLDEFFSDIFGGVQQRQVQSIGSGVVFSEDGFIITNAHVVEGATQIKVVFNDGKEIDARLVGIDSVHDIAIIKCNGKNFSYAKLGSSSDLIIGEWVIAVGNPYGFLIKDSKPSVSVGVISAVNRNFSQKQDNKIYKGMIQTDAAINPGNSGGPLVNINGEVIGINSFILSETGGSVGIGFAIPVDRVKKIAEELIKYGRTKEPYFGFKIQDLTPMIASYLNLNSLDGVIISAIDSKGPAGKAGLVKGDIITEINSVSIKNSGDAELAVSDISPGDQIKVRFIRNSKKYVVDMQAGEYR